MIDRLQKVVAELCGLFAVGYLLYIGGLMKKLIDGLRDFFIPKNSEAITKEIDKVNIGILNRISLFIIIYETVIYLLLLCGIIKTADFKVTTFSMIFVTGLSVIAFLYTQKNKRTAQSHKVFSVIISIVYLCFIAYGIRFCYLYDADLIVFYMVIVSLAAFIRIKPCFSIIVIIASFTTLFLLLKSMGNPLPIQNNVNYFGFMAICCAVSLTGYHLLRDKLIKQQELLAMNTALYNVSRYDTLTRLKNRNALVEDSANYYNKPICIVVGDCDHFKYINDTYGHIVGDKAIIAIANVLKEYITEDYIYRYGGDEFLVVNMNPDEEAMNKTTENIHYALDNIKIEGIDEKISISFGKEYGTAKNGNEFEELLKRADRNMYKAKQLKK